MLFEVLTRERLFTGDSEIGVLDAVRDCRIRSVQELEPSIPNEVGKIVQKALAKTPETRYSTAGEMEADIKDVLERIKPTPSQTDLAAYLDQLFKAPGEVAPAKAINLESAPAQLTSPPAQPTAATSPRPPAAADAGAGKKSALPKILIAVLILAALAAAAVFFLKKQSEDSRVPPSTTPAPAAVPATAPPATTGPEGAPATGDTVAGDTTASDTTPGGEDAEDVGPAGGPADESATAAPDLDLEGLIGEELATEKERLQRQFDEERRQLEAEIAKAQADGSGNEPDGI